MTSRGCERSREGHQCTSFHQSPIYRRVNEQILQSDYQYGNGVHWVSHCCKMTGILLRSTPLHNCVCLFVFHRISFITFRGKNKHEKEINFVAALQHALIYNRRHCKVCKYRPPPPRKMCVYLNRLLFCFRMCRLHTHTHTHTHNIGMHICLQAFCPSEPLNVWFSASVIRFGSSHCALSLNAVEDEL